MIKNDWNLNNYLTIENLNNYVILFIIMKVAFFGGSFDPPHIGHKKIIDYCIQSFDKVLLVPNKKSVDQYKNNIASINERLEMLKIVFDSKLVEIIDFEIESGVPNYTYYTVEYLKKKYDNDDLFMILGADQVYNLTNWYKYQYLVDNIKIICFNRKIDIDNELKDSIKKIDIDFVDFNYDCSSSDIRGVFLENKGNVDLCFQLLSSYLDKDIFDYIIQNDIYVK